MNEAIIADIIEREQRILTKLNEERPDLPTVTAIVMSGDYAAAEVADEKLRAGEWDFDQAVRICGSYSRCDMAVRWERDGFTTRDHLLDLWPNLWVDSDPDDTDPRFLHVWRECRARNGDVVIDDTPLPEQMHYDLFRGQPPGATPGLSWSLDHATALKFANGAWARQAVAGEVIGARVKRKNILAYLTTRGEEEIVLDLEVA